MSYRIIIAFKKYAKNNNHIQTLNLNINYKLRLIKKIIKF